MFQIGKNPVPQDFAPIRLLRGGVAFFLFPEIILIPIVSTAQPLGERHVHAPAKLSDALRIVENRAPKGLRGILRRSQKARRTHLEDACRALFKFRIGNGFARGHIDRIGGMIPLGGAVHRIDRVVDIEEVARLIRRPEQLVRLSAQRLHHELRDKSVILELPGTVDRREAQHRHVEVKVLPPAPRVLLLHIFLHRAQIARRLPVRPRVLCLRREHGAGRYEEKFPHMIFRRKRHHIRQPREIHPRILEVLPAVHRRRTFRKMEHNVKIVHAKNVLTALVDHAVRIKSMLCSQRLHRLGRLVVDDVDVPALLGKASRRRSSQEPVAARE